MRRAPLVLLALLVFGCALAAPGPDLLAALRLHVRELLALASFGALGGLVLWQWRG